MKIEISTIEKGFKVMVFKGEKSPSGIDIWRTLEVNTLSKVIMEVISSFEEGKDDKEGQREGEGLD